MTTAGLLTLRPSHGDRSSGVRRDENVVTEYPLEEHFSLSSFSARRYTLPTPDHHQRRRRPDRQRPVARVVSATSRRSVKFFTDIAGDFQYDGVAITCFWKASLMPSSAPAALLEDVVFVLFRSAALSPATTSKRYGRWRRRIPTMKSR
jgi:hypothetical protein